MLEAVTSVLQTAPIARGSAEQVSGARSFAANPDKIQEAPRAPYISPFIYMDVNYDKAVLQIRDSETGDVLTQFPSESRLRAQSTAAEQVRTRDSASDSSPTPSPQETHQPQQSAPVQQQAPAPSAGSAVTAQQLAAFKTASTSASAGNGGQVSLFA